MKHCLFCNNIMCSQHGVDGFWSESCDDNADANSRAMVKCAGCGKEIPVSESTIDELGNIICEWCNYIAQDEESEYNDEQ